MPETCANIKSLLVELQGKGLSSTAKLVAILEACKISERSEIEALLELKSSTLREARRTLKNQRQKSSAANTIDGNPAPEFQRTAGNTAQAMEIQRQNSSERQNSSVGTDLANAHATKESPTEISISNNQLASLPTDDISQLMITDIVSWMHGADRSNAEQWLSNTTKMYGSDITRQSYHKLKTDILTGSVIARKLQAWCGIAQRMQSAPPKPAADVIPFKTSPELQQTAAIFAKIKAQGASNAAG